MKNILFACLLISLFACNNQTESAKETKESAVENLPVVSKTVSCGSLILFHKGAQIEGTSYDAAGKETTKQLTTITDVTDAGGVLTATSSAKMMSAAAGKTMNLTYTCDGTYLSLDMSSMLQNFGGMANLKGVSKPILFPINISVGENLPDASYTMSVERAATKMDVTSTIKNRTVAALENITTTAGSWDCYKVTADMSSAIESADANMKKIMEQVQSKIKMSMIMWYTPKIGIVRTEMYQNGKLNSRSEITAIKE